jgi:hypothetical protein
MANKNENPYERNLARTKREQATSRGEEVYRKATDPISYSSCPQKEKPSTTSKNKGETICAAGNVINRRTMNRMHGPK